MLLVFGPLLFPFHFYSHHSFYTKTHKTNNAVIRYKQHCKFTYNYSFTCQHMNIFAFVFSRIQQQEKSRIGPQLKCANQAHKHENLSMLIDLLQKLGKQPDMKERRLGRRLFPKLKLLRFLVIICWLYCCLCAIFTLSCTVRLWSIRSGWLVNSTSNRPWMRFWGLNRRHISRWVYTMKTKDCSSKVHN